MAGFSAEWLALREPADHAARSADLTRALLEQLPVDRSLRILDLGAGSGSNLRYLTNAMRACAEPRRSADWLLVDHDPLLLARVPQMPGIETRCLDLASLDDRGIFEGRDIVTASALLDLVSESWVNTLADRCEEARAAVLFALSYDGRIVCAPADEEDAAIVALVNAHQRTDKGFGRALGPDAADAAARRFGERGYRVTRERSDWVLPPEMAELQRQLIDGWAQAAIEMAPERLAVIDAWRARRLAHVAANRSEIIVGHEDLVGILGFEDLRS